MPRSGGSPRPDYPESLRRRGILNGAGELLWLEDTVGSVIEWLSAAGWGILAVEAYQSGVHASGSFVADQTVQPGWRLGEAWDDYVVRAAHQGSLAVEDLRRLTSPRGPDPAVRYFIAACPESDFPRHRRT